MKRSIEILGKTAIFTLLLGMSGFVAKAGRNNFQFHSLQDFQFVPAARKVDREIDLKTKKDARDAQPLQFQLAQARVNPANLLDGGPPKDGIPSIDSPQFDTASSTPFRNNEEIIGVVVNGEAKAYPIGILNWHEIANDTIGGVNVSVTYCPLCDTAIVFDRGNTTFGVSGKLYQSCLVMYDRADDTLYVQPWGLGVLGRNVNRNLPRVPAVKTTLGAWLDRYPDSQILSTNTGYQRNYQRYPYGTYNQDRRIIFPVRNQDELELHPKAAISYIWTIDSGGAPDRFAGDSVQFIHREIEQMGERTIEFDGRSIRAYWDDTLETVVVEEADGTLIPAATAFAFVYPAFMGD
ncbi:MAG: DUF3179 domain-containing protein [Cyanobacteria bacterium SID2]|nr:DUF3179 domain-containing protein [Cyanobacteria bacterium SID2]MBP0003362.1 DUF3179 domain-containing protein [Cyanobacteria bacterium SBC]